MENDSCQQPLNQNGSCFSNPLSEFLLNNLQAFFYSNMSICNCLIYDLILITTDKSNFI
jgi:hypothetical protein